MNTKRGETLHGIEPSSITVNVSVDRYHRMKRINTQSPPSIEKSRMTEVWIKQRLPQQTQNRDILSPYFLMTLSTCARSEFLIFIHFH